MLSIQSQIPQTQVLSSRQAQNPSEKQIGFSSSWKQVQKAMKKDPVFAKQINEVFREIHDIFGAMILEHTEYSKQVNLLKFDKLKEFHPVDKLIKSSCKRLDKFLFKNKQPFENAYLPRLQSVETITNENGWGQKCGGVSYILTYGQDLLVLNKLPIGGCDEVKIQFIKPNGFNLVELLKKQGLKNADKGIEISCPMSLADISINFFKTNKPTRALQNKIQEMTNVAEDLSIFSKLTEEREKAGKIIKISDHAANRSG